MVVLPLVIFFHFELPSDCFSLPLFSPQNKRTNSWEGGEAERVTQAFITLLLLPQTFPLIQSYLEVGLLISKKTKPAR